MDAGDTANPPVALCAGRPRYKSANRTTHVARQANRHTMRPALYRRQAGSVTPPPPPLYNSAPGHTYIEMQPATPPERRQRPRGRHHDAKERRILEMNDTEFLRMVGQIYEYALSKEDDDDYILNMPQ